MKYSKLATFIVTSGVVGITGCANQNVATNLNETSRMEYDINPEKNADGNYNILFVTTDQERYFDEYPEGTEYEARQLLEELGTTFEKHYACSNMSTSSRSVIYTGTHITDTDMIDNTDFPWQNQLSPDKITIGDRLRETGLYTAYKGKWHMGNASVIMEVENPTTDLEDYGFADWGVEKDYIGEVQEGYKIDPVIIADSVEWMKTTGSELNENGQSFFLAVNLINPHDIMNYETEEGAVTRLETAGAPDYKIYEKQYAQDIPLSWNQSVTEDTLYAIKAYRNLWYRNMGKIEDDRFKDMQDYYFNCIQDSDNNLMTLLTELDNLHMLDNTIIVFTSDHGEMHGEHGLKGKGGFIYDSNIHVPMIIYHPDYEGGKSINTVTSHMDLAPTFVDMTFISDKEKAEITKDLSGNSLMDLMDGSKESVREGALFCFEMLNFAVGKTEDADGDVSLSVDNRTMVRAIITEDYKFARYFSPLNFNMPVTIEELIANNDIELYDLKNDPDEMNNLALDLKANEALIMELNTKLNQLIEKEIGVDNGDELEIPIKMIEEAFVTMPGLFE